MTNDVWKAWLQMASGRAVYRRLKKISVFMFLNKFMKRHLRILRKYAYVRKVKRNISDSLKLKRIKIGIFAFKKNTVK